MDWFVDWFLGWFYELLYGLQAGLCSLIDFIKRIFFKLCGLDTVVIDGESQDLVSSLIGSDTIRRVFLTIYVHKCSLFLIWTSTKESGAEIHSSKALSKRIPKTLVKSMISIPRWKEEASIWIFSRMVSFWAWAW